MAEQFCCICGRHVRSDYWVCRPCRRQHNLPAEFHDWPQWARAMVILEQDARRYYECEETFRASFCDGDDDVTQEPSPHLRTRDGLSYDGLPLSPYDNEADNLTYRRTNKVTR